MSMLRAPSQVQFEVFYNSPTCSSQADLPLGEIGWQCAFTFGNPAVTAFLATTCLDMLEKTVTDVMKMGRDSGRCYLPFLRKAFLDKTQTCVVIARSTCERMQKAFSSTVKNAYARCSGNQTFWSENCEQINVSPAADLTKEDTAQLKGAVDTVISPPRSRPLSRSTVRVPRDRMS